MLKFIIVEDEEKYVEKFKKIINKFKYKIDGEVKTLVFNGYTKALHNEIKNTEEKTIYILDIELDGSKSGIQIASLIRENDWNSEIIFITNHDKMFESAHRAVYEVFDFIEKYHDLEKRLEKDIKTILSKCMDKKSFIYKGRNVDLQLYLDSINYIYRDKEDRKIIIVTDNTTYSINLSLKEILEKIDDRFVMIHRSCIVNRDKVESYDWCNSIVNLKNGDTINYLSKKFKKEIECV